ncbi:MAG TPA: thiol:disulfide interchange protein DsbA/DsbL [Rubrivivax sp.]|nr:thiol:disulfide interchange protein DsbA/DsbL [Rubrivivax sp.]
MKLVHALFCAWLVAVAGLLPGCAGTGPVAGRDYMQIEPAQPVAGGGQIVVVEFFWYGCPHCSDMHPRLKAWAQRQGADVVLRYQPVIARERWEGGARMHFTLEAMGERARLADALFEATQLEGLDLNDETVMLDWAARQGLDRRRFAEVYRSPEVQREVEAARTVGQRYQLSGVPSFAVDGKYLTSNTYTGSADDTLAMVDRLVQKARDERGQPRR